MNSFEQPWFLISCTYRNVLKIFTCQIGNAMLYQTNLVAQLGPLLLVTLICILVCSFDNQLALESIPEDKVELKNSLKEFFKKYCISHFPMCSTCNEVMDTCYHLFSEMFLLRSRWPLFCYWFEELGRPNPSPRPLVTCNLLSFLDFLLISFTVLTAQIY